MENIYERIAALRIVPVIAIEDVAAALPLADALAEGGLPVAEITFRTDAAASVIERIARERPEVLVGAGTILTTDNLMRAVECGAAFGVAPGFNPAIVARALELKFPFSPGIIDRKSHTSLFRSDPDDRQLDACCRMRSGIRRSAWFQSCHRCPGARTEVPVFARHYDSHRHRRRAEPGSDNAGRKRELQFERP